MGILRRRASGRPVSTDEQFQAAGEHVKAIAQLRSRLESVIRPYIDFWHQAHKGHTQLPAMLDGPLEARERSIKQGLARYQREKEEARVNGFWLNANIPGIEVWMDCETSVRRKLRPLENQIVSD